MVVMPDCGGGWIHDTGGGGPGAIPPLVLEQISKFGEKGVVISGLVAWMEAQMDTQGSDIWLSLAERCFQDSEVSAAKEALKLASGTALEALVTDFNKNRKGENKKVKELDDIKRAVLALREAGKMPLVMATSKQLTRCPQSWGVPDSPSSQDIMGKISYLEKAMADSIEQQKEQFKQIRAELAPLKASQIPKSPSIPVVTFGSDTPNTKKRKIAEESENSKQNAEYPPLQQSYADIAGISPLGQGQEVAGLKLLQNILRTKAPQTPKAQKNICFGISKSSQDGSDCTNLSADVNLVATGVAKDCTKDNLKEYLVAKGIKVVEVEQLTKQEVLSQVRTLTFRVAIKASDYEAALKPEIWPFRVGVRHYRPPRRDRPEGGWQGQSRQSGGNVTGALRGQGEGQLYSDTRHLGAAHRLPPGHPGRAGASQQLMSAPQQNPVELSNMWNILATLGSRAGLNQNP